MFPQLATRADLESQVKALKHDLESQIKDLKHDLTLRVLTIVGVFDGFLFALLKFTA